MTSILKVDTLQDSGGNTMLSSDGAGNITTSSLADNSVSLAKLTATGTKDATTFLRGDNTFVTVSSDCVLLATSTASSSASISFDGYFSSTYSNYIIFINNMRPATDGAHPYIRFRRNNADITAGDYKYIDPRARISSNGSTGIETGESAWTGTSIAINQDMDNSGLWSLNGTIQIYDPLDTVSYPSCIFDTTASETTGTELYRRFGTARLSSTGALSGITFYFSSGNITSGKFKLYGFK